MAVIVTDLRTVVDEADNTTGWNTGTAVTDIFAEATHSIAVAANTDTVQIYHTGASRSLSNHLIYVYAFNNAIQSTWTAANPPIALHIGDGTNRISFKMAGGDKKVFVHADGPTDWQQLVLDTSQAAAMNSAGLTIARAGSFGNLNLSALTQFGGDYTTLSKALGGGFNTATDIIRVGNDGLRITGGTTGDRGTFFEIVLEDRSTANLKAHGIIREYSTGFYGAQGPFNFSDTTGNSWFDDSNATVIFEDRNIGNDKYYIRVWGGTGETHFFLRNSTITTAGPFVTCLFNDNNINTLELRSTNFNNLGNAITFGTDTPAQSHVVNLCGFNACGQINPGVVSFTNNTIANSTSSATGALILDRLDATNLSNISFNSGETGHAIYITQAGTYTFTNFTYTGYGASGTTDAAVYNNSGGEVNINLSGGMAPTVRNGAGSTTNVIVTATLTLTGLPQGTLTTIVEVANRDNVLFQGTVGATNQIAYSYGGEEAGMIVDVLFMNQAYDPNIGDLLDFTLPSIDATLPISLIIDRTYIQS